MLKLENDNKDLIENNIQLAFDIIQLFNNFNESSEKWFFSVHWLYTVCLPNILDEDNPKYSPIYKEYGDKLPKDQFGELNHLDVGEDGSLIKHGDKLLADSRFTKAGIWRFGESWDNSGVVINTDDDGHPIYDEFSGWIKNKIDVLSKKFTAIKVNDSYFEAFLIGHTRDMAVSDRDAILEHKESHFHGVLNLPRKHTKYQIMESLGVNFDDYVKTFDWIVETKGDDAYDRIKAFVSSLKGLSSNFEKINDYRWQ